MVMYVYLFSLSPQDHVRVGKIAQMAEHLPGTREALGSIPSTTTYTRLTPVILILGVKARSDTQGQAHLYREFEASLGYMGLSLKAEHYIVKYNFAVFFSLLLNSVPHHCMLFDSISIRMYKDLFNWFLVVTGLSPVSRIINRTLVCTVMLLSHCFLRVTSREAEVVGRGKERLPSF